MGKHLLFYSSTLLLYLLVSYATVNVLLLIGVRLFAMFTYLVDEKSFDFSSKVTPPTWEEIGMIQPGYVFYYVIAYCFVIFGLYQFWMYRQLKKAKEKEGD